MEHDGLVHDRGSLSQSHGRAGLQLSLAGLEGAVVVKAVA